ncbi:hypothetical protein [Oscillibacter sp.]|uniref:hypothetical protein n=1 Tax=Oscillibacter sp. TaxID=1945593 RepID=UPI002D7F152F|nr:hypothetical protein [Oscillibacter sp.]MBS6353898.1 hypothetical protein [Oscillibacter sp.]
MDYEKLVAELRDWLPPESEKIPYGELVGAPYPYNLQGPLVYADEVCNLVEEAADAITALLDENALKNRKSMWRKLLEAVKSAFGWGTKERRTLMDIEKLRKSLLENSDPDGPCIEDDLMQAAATALSPPNDPLTLEELRKMDGEPAWWDDGEGSCWGIISVDSAGMWGGIPFLRGRWRQVNFEYNIEERKMRIYRRPPEGEEDGNV